MVQSLLHGEQIVLNALDLEHDAETIAAWTLDPQYWNLYERDAPRPLSPSQVKKKYAVDPKNEATEFQFAIRTLADWRLIGLASLHWIDWSNSNAWLTLAIGSASDRGRGFAVEALDLLLIFAFSELNLFRLQTNAPEFALSWRELLEEKGFTPEVSQRKEIQRGEREWDLLIYGLLAEEWAAVQANKVAQDG